jgi:excisionase family DNA binding protein
LTYFIKDDILYVYKNYSKEDTMEKNILTIYEVADLLGLHHKTVRGFITDGKLNAIKVGKQWRITKADLDYFMGKENMSSLGKNEIIQLDIEENNIKFTTENSQCATERSRISISTVIDIKAVDKEKFERLSNTLLAVMNSKDDVFEHSTIHIKYDKERNLCKLLLWGNADYITEMISIITILDNEKD